MIDKNCYESYKNPDLRICEACLFQEECHLENQVRLIVNGKKINDTEFEFEVNGELVVIRTEEDFNNHVLPLINAIIRGDLPRECPSIVSLRTNSLKLLR